MHHRSSSESHSHDIEKVHTSAEKLYPSPSKSKNGLAVRLLQDTAFQRVTWLIGLLVFQSTSSFILAHYSTLLQKHTIVVYFLTMLVGAGGNAGNQSVIFVVRGLATGEFSMNNIQGLLCKELVVAIKVSGLLVFAGFFRVYVSYSAMSDVLAITTSLFLIVFSSIIIGTLLPILLQKLGIDPAHAGASVQVIMDILGVLLTCVVCQAILAEPTQFQPTPIVQAASFDPHCTHALPLPPTTLASELPASVMQTSMSSSPSSLVNVSPSLVSAASSLPAIGAAVAASISSHTPHNVNHPSPPAIPTLSSVFSPSPSVPSSASSSSASSSQASSDDAHVNSKAQFLVSSPEPSPTVDSIPLTSESPKASSMRVTTPPVQSSSHSTFTASSSSTSSSSVTESKTKGSNGDANSFRTFQAPSSASSVSAASAPVSSISVASPHPPTQTPSSTSSLRNNMDRAAAVTASPSISQSDPESSEGSQGIDDAQFKQVHRGKAAQVDEAVVTALAQSGLEKEMASESASDATHSSGFLISSSSSAPLHASVSSSSLAVSEHIPSTPSSSALSPSHIPSALVTSSSPSSPPSMAPSSHTPSTSSSHLLKDSTGADLAVTEGKTRSDAKTPSSFSFASSSSSSSSSKSSKSSSSKSSSSSSSASSAAVSSAAVSSAAVSSDSSSANAHKHHASVKIHH